MAYTSIDDPSGTAFNTVLYTGNGGTQTITGVGFQADWLWFKERSVSGNHQILDSVRSSFTKNLITNSTGAEGTTSTYITSVNSDGFALGTNNAINQSGVSNVAWCWKAGGSASSNTDGSITSTVSANTTAGFSIVSYTGTGSNATIGHGLGSVPAWIITKNRDATQPWRIYHKGVDASAPEDYGMILNDTSVRDNDNTAWNDTAPTSSVFSVGSSANTNNGSDDFIAYCFAEKKGYSKFGSYIGNGNANGTFVYTGYKPAMIIFKNTGTSNRQWQLLDNKRSSSGGNNVINITISPNNANDESWWGTNNYADFLSNGFKLRASYDGVNEGSGNYIYMAFAESPFVNSSGVPTTAR